MLSHKKKGHENPSKAPHTQTRWGERKRKENELPSLTLRVKHDGDDVFVE